MAVAFAEATAQPGAVTFGVDSGLSAALGGYTDADFRADVQTLHARGKKVILSVGGEAGRVAVNDATSATQVQRHDVRPHPAVRLRRRRHRPGERAQPDLHGAGAAQPAQPGRAGLIITMAPQTIDMQTPTVSYFKLALDIRDILTVVHTQFYNSGSMLGCDQSSPTRRGRSTS